MSSGPQADLAQAAIRERVKASPCSEPYDFYRASAGLHQLTGDFFRSSFFTKKSTPGDISATVVPFKKGLAATLCVAVARPRDPFAGLDHSFAGTGCF
jgi:hypothetical protein